MPRYVLACSTHWALEAFLKRRPRLPGHWIIVTTPYDLETEVFENESLHNEGFSYIFFPHWRGIVPDWIVEHTECVAFHMTDLPHGRGGSPLQNLIKDGAKSTVVTAFRMTKELDAGPVYDKLSMSLDGTADECYARAAELSMDLMQWIVETEPAPYQQKGEPMTFRRRKPEESALPEDGTIEQLYDHIRMLDATGYPNAFIECGNWHFRFSRAERIVNASRNEVMSTVCITKKQS